MMRNEFTAIIEQSGEWFVGWCAEIPEANGQGKTVEECRVNLSKAISLVLEDRREDALRGLPTTALLEAVQVIWSALICSDTFASMAVI